MDPVTRSLIYVHSHPLSPSALVKDPHLGFIHIPGSPAWRGTMNVHQTLGAMASWGSSTISSIALLKLGVETRYFFLYFVGPVHQCTQVSDVISSTKICEGRQVWVVILKH
jgi:hypothetical protein